MKSIQLVDCTLRDGGHLNGGQFGERIIKDVLEKLIASKIDIIEVGFVTNDPFDIDKTRYRTIADVKRVLPRAKHGAAFSLMANHCSVEQLEPYDGTIEYVRLAFKRQKLDWAMDAAKSLMKKGYKVVMNPVNCNVYSDSDFIALIEKINAIKPFGFTIVDTFGVMRIRDMSHFYYLVENNLDQDITVGIHLHENLGLSYALAQHFINISYPQRDIIVDCSLLGMGRDPGNLHTELIMDHLNQEFNCRYATEPALDAIDDYIAPLKNELSWGYSIPYLLAAKYKLHRTYAEYLMNKKRLRTKDVQRILALVDHGESELFNEEYVERLYRGYLGVNHDDSADIRKLTAALAGRAVLILAPGSTLKKYHMQITDFIKKESPVTISVNFKAEEYSPSMVFCANKLRYEMENIAMFDGETIVTSNLVEVAHPQYVVNLNNLAYFNDYYAADSTLLLLNLLKTAGVKRIYVAGFDGFGQESNFVDEVLDIKNNSSERKPDIQGILASGFTDLTITSLTPSVYFSQCAFKEDER